MESAVNSALFLLLTNGDMLVKKISWKRKSQKSKETKI